MGRGVQERATGAPTPRPPASPGIQPHFDDLRTDSAIVPSSRAGMWSRGLLTLDLAHGVTAAASDSASCSRPEPVGTRRNWMITNSRHSASAVYSAGSTKVDRLRRPSRSQAPLTTMWCWPPPPAGEGACGGQGRMPGRRAFQEELVADGIQVWNATKSSIDFRQRRNESCCHMMASTLAVDPIPPAMFNGADVSRNS